MKGSGDEGSASMAAREGITDIWGAATFVDQKTRAKTRKQHERRRILAFYQFLNV